MIALNETCRSRRSFAGGEGRPVTMNFSFTGSTSPALMSSLMRMMTRVLRLLLRQALWKPLCTLGRFQAEPRLGWWSTRHACGAARHETRS